MRFPSKVRPLEDDEVDRLGVEVQQCMELTSTNRSRAYPRFEDAELFRIQFSGSKSLEEKLFGGEGGGVPHVPIPNTTVKPSSADGTWTAGSWESRTSPSEL
jgi:hypothetical protein